MSVIKELRKQYGLTQKDLAQKTGLSLRTIQRVEASNKSLQGHTLQTVSQAFNMEAAVLQHKFVGDQSDVRADKQAIRLINLSALACMCIPFGNLILPFHIWRNCPPSEHIDEIGGRIINFQIIWTAMLCTLLCIAPFVDMTPPSSTPLILYVLFIALAINIVVICATANRIQQDQYDFLNLPIRLL